MRQGGSGQRLTEVGAGVSLAYDAQAGAAALVAAVRPLADRDPGQTPGVRRF